jgi:hypothetical protein
MFEAAVFETAGAKQELDRFFAVADGENVIGQVLAPQGVQREFKIVRIVFHE